MNKTLIALLATSSLYFFGSAHAADAAKPMEKTTATTTPANVPANKAVKKEAKKASGLSAAEDKSTIPAKHATVATPATAATPAVPAKK